MVSLEFNFVQSLCRDDGAEGIGRLRAISGRLKAG